MCTELFNEYRTCGHIVYLQTIKCRHPPPTDDITCTKDGTPMEVEVGEGLCPNCLKALHGSRRQLGS
jgi:hypothetical protein